jgi:hypothetical protein
LTTITDQPGTASAKRSSGRAGRIRGGTSGQLPRGHSATREFPGPPRGRTRLRTALRCKPRSRLSCRPGRWRCRDSGARTPRRPRTVQRRGRGPGTPAPASRRSRRAPWRTRSARQSASRRVNCGKVHYRAVRSAREPAALPWLRAQEAGPLPRLLHPPVGPPEPALRLRVTCPRKHGAQVPHGRALQPQARHLHDMTAPTAHALGSFRISPAVGGKNPENVPSLLSVAPLQRHEVAPHCPSPQSAASRPSRTRQILAYQGCA